MIFLKFINFSKYLPSAYCEFKNIIGNRDKTVKRYKSLPWKADTLVKKT